MTADTNSASSADKGQQDSGRTFIARFYGKEQAADSEERTLDDICLFTDDQLEHHHDYIQVLFPLPERSGVVPGAPIITKATRDAFLEDEDLRKRLFGAFTRMAHFYAFDISGDENDLTVTPMADFKKLARNTWLTGIDHNHLRISRIIRSLRVLGLETVAQAFYKAIAENATGVSPRSLMYWERAAKRPLCFSPDQPDNSGKIIEWLKNEEN